MVSPLVALTALGGCGSLLIAGLVWRRRDAPGARALAGTLVAFALYAFVYATALTVFDPQLRFGLLVPIAGLAFATPVGYAVFALQYTGRGQVLSGWTLAFVVHPAPLAAVGIATNHLHGLAVTDVRIVETVGAATTAFEAGPILIWVYAVSYLLTGIGTYALLRAGFSGEGKLYRGQALGIAAWSGVIGLANVAYFLQLGPLPAFDASPIAAGLVGVVLWYPIYDDVVFKQVPAVQLLGRDAVLEHIDEAVFVVDEADRVIDCNAAAASLVGDANLVGRSVSDVLDGAAPPRDDATIELDTASGRRTFDVVSSPVADGAGRRLGRTVVLHDVTDRERRQERLQVFNRVLRHNLRNELEVARGHVEHLGSEVPSDEADAMADRATTALDSLAALGETAREIDRIAGRERSPSRTDVCELVRSVVADLEGRYPDAAVVVDCDGPIEARLDGYVLEAVLEALVDNAIAHNDRGTPSVRIVATHQPTADPDLVELTIADDGPGIPDHELAALLEGEERPLAHGSGLGLWLVKWGVAELDGDLDIAPREPRGTTVTIRVPVAPTATD